MDTPKLNQPLKIHLTTGEEITVDHVGELPPDHPRHHSHFLVKTITESGISEFEVAKDSITGGKTL